MRIAVLVASRNRPDLVDAMAASLAANTSMPYDLHVVECGTDRDKLSAHSTLWYADPDFRGKCWGHNLALQAAKSTRRYDYYFVVHNDVVFADGVDALKILVEQMEREPQLAILSPTNADGGYPSAERRGGDGWRPVTTCDYLGFLMRASAEDQVGFLNPEFQYCWGAIHELSYKLYSKGWIVAYSDAVSYKHLGGSTYGQKDTKTISREEYQRRAKRFAFEYFRAGYGDAWNEVFWAATKPHVIAIDTFTEHKRYWSTAFEPTELAAFGYDPARVEPPLERRMTASERPGLVKLHLGCGTEKRAGWTNVDVDPRVAPDVVSDVTQLTAFATGSVDVVEANHLFEHLTFDQARAALREWARVLRPGGELFLEMPDFEACTRMIGRHFDSQGHDLAMVGIYGWPPDIAKGGVPQMHKWGWSRTTLARAVAEAGFERAEFGPITQTWRPAAKAGSLLRLRAVRASLPGDSDERASTGGRSADSAVRRGSTTVATRTAFRLNTERPLRVFAWPDWRSSEEVERLFTEFAPKLAGRDDACLCVRRDPQTDPPLEELARILEQAYELWMEGDAALDVLVVEDPIGPDDQRALSEQVTCAVAFPSSRTHPRSALSVAFRGKTVRSESELSTFV